MTIIYKWICPNCREVYNTKFEIDYCNECGYEGYSENKLSPELNVIVTKLERKLKHFKKNIESFQNGETKEQLAKHKTFIDGWNIGYFEGRINEIEDILIELGVDIDE